MFRKPLTILLLFVALFYTASSMAGSTAFPRPAGLEPDVNFWRRVYSEIDGNQGFIHDNERLAIVYQTLNVPEGKSRKQRQNVVDAAKRKIVADLNVLASGKRQGLTGRQQEILMLWGSGTSNSQFRAAANRVRFQLGQSDKFRAGLVRSGRWLPYIQKTFRDMGLPQELTILPHVESSFNPEAYSRVGASGMWQFTRGTGRQFMQVDHIVDDRRDPFTATVAAGKLLARNLEITGTWPLALTGYNHGAAGMARAAKALGTTDIETIARKYKGRTFGFASRNFYVSFLAALDISRNPAKYFGSVKMDAPDTPVSVTLNHYVAADSIAKALRLDIATLKKLNPALLDPVWQGEKHIPAGYTLRLPAAMSNAVAMLDAVPSAQRFAEQIPDKYHRIRAGETLSGIAKRHGLGVRQLMAMNNISNANRIRAGQTLVLPGAGSSSSLALARRGQSVASESPFTAAVFEAAAIEVKLPFEIPHDPAPFRVALDDTIRVQAAETLGLYAEWLGVSVDSIRKMNGMRKASDLHFGARLKLDFNRVSRNQFQQRRDDFHKAMADDFARKYQVVGAKEYRIRPGETLWSLVRSNPDVPLWLICRYNPSIDFSAIPVGAKLAVPVVRQAG
ncbi:MAG: LysM peptidoglycan-binding domain-containing protein [bacterium]